MDEKSGKEAGAKAIITVALQAFFARFSRCKRLTFGYFSI